MGNTPENKIIHGKESREKNIVIGILAHVDSGKTTLSEALLYKTGVIKKQGRVDHGDAFFDTDSQERERGITIFSKQAVMKYNGMRITLLDTPGHVDFSAETERTLEVLDYAVLAVSGRDGVQGHTATLWKLLERYRVPVFIFVNKMDMEGTDRNALSRELAESLDQGCLDFSGYTEGKTSKELIEKLALCDERLLEEYLGKGSVSREAAARAVAERKVFPCFFGSALRLEGVDELLEGLDCLTEGKTYGRDFGARVYKITRDERNTRLTHMKITGGTLRVKDVVSATGKEEEGEKAEQIRIYSGEKYETAESVSAGDICAVAGLKKTCAGQRLGKEGSAHKRTGKSPVLQPALVYRVLLSEGADVHESFLRIKELEEEDPLLQAVWDRQAEEIQLRLMGPVQLEILKKIFRERFDLELDFGEGSIAYKETIRKPVIGSGHFEPLRHYAEVHLLMEPAERGKGLIFDSACSEDELDRNWQRLIMTHLREKEHTGVLTGSPVTDIKITLVAGRAHLKHTEGGDFRQAVYRAVRQGLRKAESVLLEPWYSFTLKIPAEAAGRAMSDIGKMSGEFTEPEIKEAAALIRGRAPVKEMKDYSVEVSSYTKGRGSLSLIFDGYEECHDSERVIEETGYDPDKDGENPADSIFCRGGAGVSVKWNEAGKYFHIDGEKYLKGRKSTADGKNENSRNQRRLTKEEEKELERIFEMTSGRNKKKKTFVPKKTILSSEEKKKTETKPAKVLEEYLLVDGYNIIFAWKQLKELAAVNMDSARQALIDILANYQGYRKCRLIVVFDAYRVKGGERHEEKQGDIDIIYTREAETADMYIERTAHEKSRDFHVRVATSDRLEQMIIFGSGAFKVSADEFQAEVEAAGAEISRLLEEYSRKTAEEGKNRIILPERKEEKK